MPQNQLTAQDVWQPSSQNMLDLYSAQEGVPQMNVLQKRVQTMNALVDAGMPPDQIPQFLKGPGGDQMVAEAQRRKAQATQQAELKQVDEGMKVIKAFKGIGGVKSLQDNWDTIKTLLPPVYQKIQIDPKGFTDEGYIIKDPQTGKEIGRWIESPDGGRPHFIKATEKEEKLDSAHLAKAQLIKEGNPNPSPEDIAKKTAEFEQLKTASSDDFKNWDLEAKKQSFEAAIIDRSDRPRFGGGMKGQVSYKQWEKEFNEYKRDVALSGSEVAGIRAERRSLEGSLNTQEKSIGMMGGFIRNINKQNERLGQILKELTRFDPRLANVPYRKWAMEVKGTPYENIVSMYATEISTELGKLASGSSASIAELSVGTREKWEHIHDLNLPVSGLKQLFDESQHAANLRIESSKEERDATRKRLNELRKQPQKGGGGGAGGSIDKFKKETWQTAPAEKFIAKLEKSNPAAQHKGAEATEELTGRKFKSDGTKWVEVK